MIDIGIVTYNDGKFEIIFKTDEKEIVFSGERKLNASEFEFIEKIAPAGVYTTYKKHN